MSISSQLQKMQNETMKKYTKILKSEVLLIIVGGVFIWETLCVIIQISSVKLRGKRVFRYTPIHYSFVLDGMSEKSVVKSFWLLSAICCVVGLVIGLI